VDFHRRGDDGGGRRIILDIEAAMTRRFLYIVPVAVFIALLGFLGWRLVLMNRGDTPDVIPSALIGKPAPEFHLPPLMYGKPGLKTADLEGHVTLVNFFATWCVPCRAEHPLLESLRGKGARLAGIAYKNEPQEVKAWLIEMGDPYDALAADRDGGTAINFGLYGVPETYVIDKRGIVRFKQTGPLTPEIIRGRILPLIRELNR
jgi:DsbE subfamily thiol:disulfide oxidoreductase